MGISVSAKQLKDFCCSIVQSYLYLYDLMNCSMPGLPVLHYLPEIAQTHVHWISDTIQPSSPLSFSSPTALSQHQGFLWWKVSSLHQVSKVVELKSIVMCIPSGKSRTLPQGCTIFFFTIPHLSLHHLLSLNSCCLMLPVGTQGRSHKLNETHCL